MRRISFLSMLLFFVVASTAMAKEITDDDLGSENQARGYGHILGFVGLGVGGIVVLLGGYVIVKGFIAEAGRGKNRFQYREQILDKKPMKQPDLYLGEKVPDWKILNRLKATKSALAFLAVTDKRFDRRYITAAARSAYLVVKASIEARTSKKIPEFATEACVEKLRSDIQKLRDGGHKRVFGDPELTDIQIVHIEAPTGKKNHTFTALYSVKSKDYLTDDRSGEIVKGDKKLYAYQEFWQFRRTKGKWLVERIRQSEDMDTVLNAKNVLSEDDLAEFSKVADEEYVREFVGH